MQATQPATPVGATDIRPVNSASKKPYLTPRLQVHGTVAELTAIGGPGTTDKQSGSVADL